MSGHRSDMVGGALREILSQLLLEEASDPRLSLVTVTEVKVSRDLSHARVFVSKLGSVSERDDAIHALNRAASYFRYEVARRTRLRRAPELVFEVDTALEEGFRVSQLLEEIRRDAPAGTDLPADGGKDPA